MNKPPIEDFRGVCQTVWSGSGRGRQDSEFLVPYFIAGHPGCDLPAMIGLAFYLKRHALSPTRCKTLFRARWILRRACIARAWIRSVARRFMCRARRQRRLQRALLQYFKPENYADVRAALEEAGRLDLLGDGPDCLIPSRPPKIVANKAPPRRRPLNGRCCKSDEPTHRGREEPSSGYRPHRKTARRRK